MRTNERTKNERTNELAKKWKNKTRGNGRGNGGQKKTKHETQITYIDERKCVQISNHFPY